MFAIDRPTDRAGEDYLPTDGNCPHGKFGELVEWAYGLRPWMCSNYMNVAQHYGNQICGHSQFSKNLLIELSRPSIPDSARIEAAEHDSLTVKQCGERHGSGQGPGRYCLPSIFNEQVSCAGQPERWRKWGDLGGRPFNTLVPRRLSFLCLVAMSTNAGISRAGGSGKRRCQGTSMGWHHGSAGAGTGGR